MYNINKYYIMENLTEEAYKKSLELLNSLVTDKGFIASTQQISNYKRVWARDGVISGLASLMTDDEVLISTFVKTLETLKQHQDETGRIPSNVSIDEKRVSYGTTVGRIDATIWYIIGVCQLSIKTDDDELFNNFRDSVEKALFYLKCLELNGRGLLNIPQGGDWADEYINHGYVLYDQILYHMALDGFYKLTKNKEILEKKEYLAGLIKTNYFLKEENKSSKYIYNEILFNGFVNEYKPPLPVAYFSNHSIRQHVDNFANSLLLLSGVMEFSDEDEIKDKIIELFFNSEFPVLPAFNPVIKEGDNNWDHLRKNFLFKFKNMPYQFHNGGLWPLVHGFFVASLGERGRKYLDDFAKLLNADGYIFPEYYNGKTHKPEGTQYLGFSASAYVIAYNSIIKNKIPFV
jgi:hypothetical protein